MLNVHLAQSRYTPCKKSDPVSLPIERGTLCAQMYAYTCCNRESERERNRKLHSIYTYHENATKVCVLHLAHYPRGILLTNTLITQRNLLAFLPRI